jgi:ketosteroid isomerase-like protein
VESSPELRDLVASWFQAATRGDSSMVDRYVSRDSGVRLIGSDPAELFAGPAVADFLRGEVEASGGNASFAPSETEAFSEGTVGWAITRLTITLPDGRSVSPRWSSVFHREDGEWKFVHTHASIGVPNDQVGWVFPT